MRKLTHEEFLDKFNKVNTHAQDIELLSNYKNARTKILCRCKIDGYKWETLPSVLLQGCSCPKCGRIIANQKTTKTHEQFIEELAQVNPNIEILGNYKNSATKILCKCKIDGHEWEAIPNRLLTGVGCPKCFDNKRGYIHKKPHEQFIQQLAQINDTIEVLSTYKTALTKIKCRCKICGKEWEVKPNSLLNGSGCPVCGRIKGIQKRTKTHEEFIKELAQVNKNIEVLGTYVNSKTKIKCRCKLDGHIWETKPNELLSGCGCPICGRRNTALKQRKTHQQFIEELVQINKDIEVLGKYVNGTTKIKVRCKICGYEWKVTPANLLRGTGCPKCIKRVKKTHEQFLQELQQVNKNIQVLGTYETGHTKIKVKCKKDGYEWEAIPNKLLNGSGCPKCYNNRRGDTCRKTHEQFIQELQQINQDIEVLGTYKTALTKIKVKCKKDAYEWEVTPASLLNGSGCPKCAGHMLKTHEQFVEELQQVNSDIEIVGTYTRGHNKIKCKCKLDGHEWTSTPKDLLRGHGCPKCSITKGEKRVAQYLDNIGINYIYNKKYFKDLRGVKGGLMKPDFLIPSLKIWIEYDGEQHFRPVDFSSKMSEEQLQEQFKKVQQNDQIKNEYAQDHNWTLIRIPYWDIDNIEQILDSYIKQEEELAL